MGLFCNFCGQPIGADYVVYEDRLQLCEPCFRAAPKCTRCQRPLPPGQAARQPPLCAGCAAAIPTCGGCGSPLLGPFWQHPLSGDLLCDGCYRARRFCDLCGGALTAHFWELSDGRRCCADCHGTAIYDPAEGRRILQQVRDFATRELGLHNSAEPSFEFVSAAEMQEICAALGDPPPAEFGRPLGSFVLLCGASHIVIEYGLPALVAHQAIAHEYAHSWQSEHCPPEQSFDLYEGFAEWVSQQYLQAHGFGQFAEYLRRRQDEYGQALAKILRLEQRLGRRRFINYVRMHETLEDAP